jgi:hypothetical protein
VQTLTLMTCEGVFQCLYPSGTLQYELENVRVVHGWTGTASDVTVQILYAILKTVLWMTSRTDHNTLKFGNHVVTLSWRALPIGTCTNLNIGSVWEFAGLCDWVYYAATLLSDKLKREQRLSHHSPRPSCESVRFPT